MKAVISVGDLKIEAKGTAGEIAGILAEYGTKPPHTRHRAPVRARRKAAGKQAGSGGRGRAKKKSRAKSAKIRTWTAVEDTKIKENYGSMTFKEMAKLLPGRTPAAINMRTIKLKNRGEMG
jgi:hypothetical protein